MKKLFMLIFICLLTVAMFSCVSVPKITDNKEFSINVILIEGPPEGYNLHRSKLNPVYYPFDEIWVYIDVKNISYEMKENEMLDELGRWICVEQKLEVYYPDGTLALEQFMFYEEGFLHLDFNMEEAFFVNYFIVPPKPVIGEYTITVTIWDHLKGISISDSVNFIVEIEVDSSIKKLL